MRFQPIEIVSIQACLGSFQFSLWDSHTGHLGITGTPLTFNSLYEIPCWNHLKGRSSVLTFNSLYEIHPVSRLRLPIPWISFQFSLWDSKAYFADNVFSRIYFQFSLWDSRKVCSKTCLLNFCLSILFMRFLYDTNESPLWKLAYFQFSLWDSPLRASRWGFTDSIFQFSLWDSVAFFWLLSRFEAF